MRRARDLLLAVAMGLLLVPLAIAYRHEIDEVWDGLDERGSDA